MTGNLLEFYRECVAPDIATGYIRMKEDILQVNNIWDSLNGKTNPSRLVTIRDLADPTLMSTVGCDAGYQSLTTQITAETSRQVTLLGSRLYPRMTSADAGVAIAGSLATSTNYLLGISSSAQDTVKQFSRNSFEVRDRQEGAGQTHQENATPSTFQKLKPTSVAGKTAETVEQVGEAAGRVADGLTGDNPGKYLTDTLAGKK